VVWLVPVVPSPGLDIDHAELDAYRPSYKCLCYVLARRGQDSNQDLPGEDKPETVAKLYGEASDWIFA
jgi:hypothetical protein